MGMDDLHNIVVYNRLYISRRFLNISPYKINHVIGIAQTAVTRDFRKLGASGVCPKILLTRSFPVAGV